MALSDSVTPSKEKTHVEKNVKAMLPLSYLLVYCSISKTVLLLAKNGKYAVTPNSGKLAFISVRIFSP